MRLFVLYVLLLIKKWLLLTLCSYYNLLVFRLKSRANLEILVVVQQLVLDLFREIPNKPSRGGSGTHDHSVGSAATNR